MSEPRILVVSYRPSDNVGRSAWDEDLIPRCREPGMTVAAGLDVAIF